MARSSNDTSSQMKDLIARLEALVAAARSEGREDALAEVRQLVTSGGTLATRPAKAPKNAAGAKKPKAAKAKKAGKPRKNPWAGLSDEDRLARINAIRKGRGLPPRESL